MAQDRSANLALSVSGANEARQNFDEVRASIEQTGPASVQTAEQITSAFRNIENAEDRVNRKISDGRAVTVRDGKVMIQQFELLKASIDQTFGSLSAAPVQVQAAFAKAEASFDRTTNTIRTMSTAVRDQQQAIAGNATEWSGFGNQLLKVSDGMRTLIIGTIGVVEALHAGWEMGNRIGAAIGTDVEITKDFTDQIKEFGRELQQSLDNAAGAAINLSTDIASADWHTAKEDAKDLGDELEQVAVRLTMTGDHFKATHFLLEQGLHVWDAYKISMADANKLMDLHSKYLGFGKEALDVYNKALREHHGNIALVNSILEAHLPTFQKYQDAVAEASKRVDLHNELLKHEEEVLKRVVEAIQAEIKKSEEAVIQFGTEEQARRNLNDATKAQLDAELKLQPAIDGTSESIKKAAEHITVLSRDYEGNVHTIQPFIATLESAKKSTVGLSAVTEEHIRRVVDATTEIAKLRAQVQSAELAERNQLETTGVSTKADETAIEMRDRLVSADLARIDELKRVVEQQSAELAATTKGVESTGQLAEGTIKVTRASGDAAGAHDKLTKAAGAAATSADSLNEHVAKMAVSMSDASGKITLVGQAQAKALTPAENLKQVLVDLTKQYKDTSGLDTYLDKLGEMRQKLAEVTSEAGKLKEAIRLVGEEGISKTGAHTPSAPTPGYNQVSEQP